MHEFVPIARSWDRVGMAREDSDTAYFYELLYLGELAAKLITLGLLSSVPGERQQHRYALEYELVRADSVGSWVKVLHDVLQGPAAAVALYESRSVRSQLTQGFAPGSCLLYTSDAADDLLCVDLGGRRIIKKKKKTNKQANRT